MQAADDYQAVYDYLRMAYFRTATQDWDSAALKQIAADAYACGTREVTITGTSSEAGGAASSERSFDKKVLLKAVMDLLREECPGILPPEAAEGTIVDLGRRYISL